ncbi:MAG: type IV secretion system protein VirB10 [Neisseria sp.]|uniref:type IV secretion system protein VirB10 n=1 Tax=Neisseria sp. TaxID=192066 RepID=UPI0026DB43DA|nr:type IV secretion system protein VirB10 [Neisseria sp.]MDO4248202.1 type IV secretion system protein VirB10 [Neisseria sp.]
MNFLKKINPLKKKHDNPHVDDNQGDAVSPDDYADGDTQYNGIEHDGAEIEGDHTGERFDEQRDLSEIVQNERVEPGIPQDLSAGTNKNMRKVAFLGVAIVAAGAAVAGLIAFTSGDPEPAADAQQAQQSSDVAANTRPKNFNQDKEKILAAEREEAAALAASAASAAAASAPTSGSASATATPADTVNTADTSQAAEKTKSPAELVRDRRLEEGIFVDDAAAGEVTLSQSDSSGGNAGGSSTSESLLGGGSGSEKSSDSGSSFAAKLTPSSTVAANAEQRGDLSYLLAKGTNIRCGLETRIVTTQPGFTRCVVVKDVYSANGKVLLVERGSKVVGEQTSALLQGQARVFVLWNELETPSGVKVSLRSPGSGALGESGHGAHVRYHFLQRFGGAIMISLINDIGNGLTTSNESSGGSNNNITYENTSESAQEMATEALKNSINIPPTGVINQGSLINIMVARDVNFDKVYDIVPNPMY